jgi:hypothetical protein
VTESVEEFITERNEAYRKLDLAWARQRCGGPVADETLLISLHKARYECTGIEAGLRQESRKWLEANNYGRMGQLPWPPAEELP